MNAARIAAAVDAFMMAADDAQHLEGEIRLVTQNLDGAGDMGAYQDQFFFGQRFLLSEHRLGQVDLADILHQPDLAEHFHGLRRHAEKTGQHHQVDGDIDGMVVGVFIRRAQAGQPDHGVGIALDGLGHFRHQFDHRLDLVGDIGVD